MILVPVLTIASCAGPAGIRWPSAIPDQPRQYRAADVPFFPQKTDQCGPAALAMTLSWSGVRISPAALTADVFTPSLKGSLQSAMIAGARRHDRIACLLPEPNALVDEIRAGHPVIVLQNLGLAWYPVWHYAVVIGLDLERRNVVLHSGTEADKLLSLDVFTRTWRRGEFWGLLVLPSSELPARSSEEAYLRAVSPLERMGKWALAAEAYATALKRWPHSLAAYLGVGVCRYARGDLKAAEGIFRQATLKFPAEGATFNNLAQVLLEQGRIDEARTAARHAVALGGPLKAEFEKTLSEIPGP
ncbi:putative peptidase, C39 family [Desulfosarcina cetonica]|nr:putative peptidase, C39 family [Desulfosarcina cetonica]